MKKYLYCQENSGSLYFEIKLSDNGGHQLVPYFRGCGFKFNMERHVGCTNNPTLVYESVV